MKHKSLSQMNKERKLKPMTLQEEYRNADVPMPNELLHASNTEEFKDDDYDGGKAYTEFLKLFFKGENKWVIKDQTI